MQQRNAPQSATRPSPPLRAGEHAARHGAPELPVAQLVHTAGLFGITENTVRVALSACGFREAVTDGAGRTGLPGTSRAPTAPAGEPGAQTTPWNGTWDLVSCARRAVRRSTQRPPRLFARARLAELREDAGCARPISSWRSRHAGADLLAGSFVPAGDGPPRRAPVDLPWWAARAETLRLELAALALGGPEDLAPGFVLSAAVLRHFQPIPVARRAPPQTGRGPCCVPTTTSGTGATAPARTLEPRGQAKSRA